MSSAATRVPAEPAMAREGWEMATNTCKSGCAFDVHNAAFGGMTPLLCAHCSGFQKKYLIMFQKDQYFHRSIHRKSSIPCGSGRRPNHDDMFFFLWIHREAIRRGAQNPPPPPSLNTILPCSLSEPDPAPGAPLLRAPLLAPVRGKTRPALRRPTARICCLPNRSSCLSSLSNMHRHRFDLMPRQSAADARRTS